MHKANGDREVRTSAGETRSEPTGVKSSAGDGGRKVQGQGRDGNSGGK